MISSDLLIFGAGGHAKTVMDLAHLCGWHIYAFVDRVPTIKSFMGIPVVAETEIEGGEFFAAIAIGDNYLRSQVAKRLVERIPLVQFPSLVHPSATVSASAQVGPGTSVHVGAYLGPSVRTGRFCLVNSLVSIEHDSRVEDFVSLGPQATLAGGSVVGTFSHVGMNSAVAQGVTIGPDVVIGASSYVRENISPECTAFGAPAKHRRRRERGEPYL